MSQRTQAARDIVSKRADVPTSNVHIKINLITFVRTDESIKRTTIKVLKRNPAKTFGCGNVAYGRSSNFPSIEALAIPGVCEENVLSPK